MSLITETDQEASNSALNIRDSACERFNPDNVFKRLKVVEFPISFVGLSNSQYLDIDVDLTTSAYLKTTHAGELLKFKDARNISARHRSFEIIPIDGRKIILTFKPKTECISMAKRKKQFDNKFVFDLRLIKVDGCRCCNDELHSEVARYYICGEYDYCNINQYPKLINFGDVVMNAKVKKYIRLKNESHLIAAKMEYVKTLGFEVIPAKFIIRPNSSKRISITIKPMNLKLRNTLTFKIRNPYFEGSINDDEENFLEHTISCKFNIIYHGTHREVKTESLQKLNEQDCRYTYLNEEVQVHSNRKDKALTYLEICKISHAKKPILERFSSEKEKCYSNIIMPFINKNPSDFCKTIRKKISTYGLNEVVFIPFFLDFGRVGTLTCGEREISIQNNSKYDITIKFLNDKCVLYTKEKLKCLIIKLKSHTDINVTLFCYGFVDGHCKGMFEYIIDEKFYRKHPYALRVGNPTLMILDKNLKFGMVTTESFVTSVPIRIYNNFNVAVDFKWDELHTDTPFEIIPNSGCIPSHTCKICDVIYSKASKTKTHEIDLVSQSKIRKTIHIELNVITRKLSIKFLQLAVAFKDIALNLETIEYVQLENSSREIALFNVLEPLIPGLTIEPMCGTIRPKMIMVFKIIVKISCVVEFSFDVFVKINNKENVILPISGNVLEPKLIIHPKYIYMARVPCNMVTYVPVTFQNMSSLRTIVEVLDTEDENIFNVYAANGNEKERVFKFCVEGGQSKTMYIKLYDVFRREYEMYIPFKINGLLGPPTQIARSSELQYYTRKYEEQYENNSKVKLKAVNKDISFCRIAGVITVPWIEFSEEKFEIDYNIEGPNTIDFTMTNISKYYLYVTILTSKISPNFTLDLQTEENQSIINETNIKFELDRKKEATFCLKFHPKGHGRFVSTALLYLDKHMTIPYYNLTFIGKRQTPIMIPETYRIIFPPCYIGTTIDRTITLKLDAESEKGSFSCVSRAEPNLTVDFVDTEIISEKEVCCTLVRVNISACCQTTYARNLTLSFNHEYGSNCEVDVSFSFTYCPLTLHANTFVTPADNPYPYFPLNTQTDLHEYYETSLKFLEKWMFQQGFRRDLYPVIPDTFHSISLTLTSQSGGKSKGINVSYLNFIRRIAGPLMKHIRKIVIHGLDEPYKGVKEIHDTYKEIINLLRSRGANLWVLQAKFLLSYDQFIIYSENVAPKGNADIILTRELLGDVNLFNRLNKQSWIDFILQSYKVFVMDSCFFDCVCMSSQPRDIIKILVDWYNEQITIRHNMFRKDKPIKIIKNITTDLRDGIALASSILNYCPFMKDNFKYFCEISDNENEEGDIVNNACLIIEAMNQLRLYFPLKSKDLLQPNFLQMLFLSIHLYVTLPMYEPKDHIKFTPPLLRSSTRQVAIAATSQESLTFNYVLLNNTNNNFIVEKASSADNGKTMFLGVKYTANFVYKESCILLVHGYNKTRIFDTYVVFLLYGYVGSLNPVRKCKVTGILYRPNKVDVMVSSPFATNATFQVYLTDIEPVIPVQFEDSCKTPRFYLRRLNLIDNEITLSGLPKEGPQEVRDHKLYLQIICLSTQIGNSWIWFRSEVGQFFIRVTTQTRWDLAIDTLLAKVRNWPMDPCSCGESCECYRTTVLMIPHRHDLMIKSLRDALREYASDTMMDVFDNLIQTTTGKIILGMLFAEGGTNMSDVQHILRGEVSYRITSRSLIPRVDCVTLAQHTSMMLPLPVTVPAHDKSEKYSVTFTSDCGMDIRTYKVLFIETTGE